jgi:hypothetical protein
MVPFKPSLADLQTRGFAEFSAQHQCSMSPLLKESGLLSRWLLPAHLAGHRRPLPAGASSPLFRTSWSSDRESCYHEMKALRGPSQELFMNCGTEIMTKITDSIDKTLEKLTAQEKLELIERLARSVRMMPAPRSAEQQRQALNQLRREMAAFPVANPTDGFSGRDHDQLLYEERK